MKKNIIFVGFVNEYELLDIQLLSQNYNVNSITLNKNLFRVINILIRSNKVKKKVIEKIFLYKLSLFENIDLVVFKDEMDYFYLLDLEVGFKKILILRNIINLKIIEEIKRFDFPIYSFDENDCKKYQINKYNQYSNVRDVIGKNNIETKFDLCFVGADKNRSDIIEAISDKLKVKYKISINIIGNKFKTKRIKYIEYLKLQLSAKVVLDIVQSNQSSETMRLIEALSMGRKVITNNISIVNHELYNESNVLLFSELDELYNKIDKFINSPFVYIDEDIISKYSSLNSLSSIINSEL